MNETVGTQGYGQASAGTTGVYIQLHLLVFKQWVLRKYEEHSADITRVCKQNSHSRTALLFRKGHMNLFHLRVRIRYKADTTTSALSINPLIGWESDYKNDDA